MLLSFAPRPTPGCTVHLVAMSPSTHDHFSGFLYSQDLDKVFLFLLVWQNLHAYHIAFATSAVCAIRWRERPSRCCVTMATVSKTCSSPQTGPGATKRLRPIPRSQAPPAPWPGQAPRSSPAEPVLPDPRAAQEGLWWPLSLMAPRWAPILDPRQTVCLRRPERSPTPGRLLRSGNVPPWLSPEARGP